MTRRQPQNRIPAETEVIVWPPETGMRFRGIIEAARRLPNSNEWKYLVSYTDLKGHATAGWWHQKYIEVSGQISLGRQVSG